MNYNGELIVKVTSGETSISSLNSNDLINIGFQKLDDSDLYLLPAWALSCISDGTVLTTVNGKEVVKGRDNIDLDTRGIWLSYGLVVK